MSDPRTIDVYNQRAKEYAETFESDKPGAHLRRFMEALPAGASVLDLGCGTGGSTAHMVDAGFIVTGMDLSPEMLAIARTRTDASFIEASFDDLNARAEYHGVWANFSLLHAPRMAVPGHLRAIHQALKPAGMFHIGVKTGTGAARDRIDRLYTYFEVEELTGLLGAAGFESLEITHGEGAGLAGATEPWVVILARKCG